MALDIDDIIELYRTAGAARYGMEAVSQEQHALQCAQHAERAGCPPVLVTAALLHDLGHLVKVAPRGSGEKNDQHEAVAIPFLRGMFPDAVIEPIRMHVDAKRYLCATQPGYWNTLSPASRRSLELQGGPLTAEEAQRFIAQPFAYNAVSLRRWDDTAKSPTAITPGWGHYRRVLERAALLERAVA
jgi:phosphonate degradation associated HDIG domain protein